jgi:hypothetical protein
MHVDEVSLGICKIQVLFVQVGSYPNARPIMKTPDVIYGPIIESVRRLECSSVVPGLSVGRSAPRPWPP